MPLGKVWIRLFSLHPWVNSSANCCILPVAIMMSVTTVHIEMQIHRQIQIQADFIVSDTNSFINFLSLVLRHGERDAILTMLTPTRRLRSLSIEIRKIQLHASTVENSTLYLNGRNLTVCPNLKCDNDCSSLFWSLWIKIRFDEIYFLLNNKL